MQIDKVKFDVSTFGITHRSLKLLRNAIAESARHKIVVVEVPIDDLCCGFMVLDYDMQSATWTGDGFRTDGGGEGGAGYKTAKVLFDIFGITPVLWELSNIEETYTLPEEEIEKKLLQLARDISSEDLNIHCRSPFENNPHYVRRG